MRVFAPVSGQGGSLVDGSTTSLAAARLAARLVSWSSSPLRAVSLVARLNVEHVIGDLVTDVGVSPDDVGQSGTPQLVDLAGAERALIPVPITVAQQLELRLDDLEEQAADMRAAQGILGQDTDPEIHVVDVGVNGGESVLDLCVRRDLVEAVGRGQGKGFARVVVAGQAVIAPALDIEGGQVEASSCGSPKRKFRTSSTT